MVNRYNLSDVTQTNTSYTINIQYIIGNSAIGLYILGICISVWVNKRLSNYG